MGLVIHNQKSGRKLETVAGVVPNILRNRGIRGSVQLQVNNKTSEAINRVRI